MTAVKKMTAYIFFYMQCNPDIRELSGQVSKSLISGLCLFCFGNAGSNLGPDKKSLLYPGYSVNRI